MRIARPGAVSRAVAITAIALLPLGGRRTEAASACRGRRWVGVWATSPSDGLGTPFVDQEEGPTKGVFALRAYPPFAWRVYPPAAAP